MEFGANNSVIDSNSDFDTIQSMIADPIIIFTLLTQLYNDLTRIIVQEYIANARDAHREIGKGDVPIDITLPNSMSDELVIRDYGLGISPDRMQNVFVHLGASTKRGDNVMTGGFGIGAKSAFCYVDSFAVDTFIDGTKRSYIFIKSGELGAPEMKFISSEETTEANGTAITINIMGSDIRAVCMNVYKLTQFWDVRPNIVNDATFYGQKYVDYNEIARGKNWMYLANGRETCVVLDGIPYRFDYNACYSGSDDDAKYKEIFSNGSFYFVFNTGEVSISPNREGLAYNNATITTIRRVVDESLIEIEDKITTHIASINNFVDAYKAMDKYSYFKKILANIRWNGLDLKSIQIDPKFYTVESYNMYKNKPRARSIYSLTPTNEKFIMCDEDELVTNKVRGIMQVEGQYNVIYFTKKKDHEAAGYTTVEDFVKAREEYEKKLGFEHINFLLSSKYEKYKAPKTIKIKGNVYRFTHAASCLRNSWELLDTQYDDLEGYYVEFNRGEPVGYYIHQLQTLKNGNNKIEIYGVPSRFLKKLKDAEDLRPLSELIDERFEDLSEFITTNKEVIYAKTHIDKAKTIQYFLTSLGDDTVEIIRKVKSLKPTFEAYDKIFELDEVPVEFAKFKTYKELCKVFNKQANDVECDHLPFETLAQDIVKIFPLSAFTNQYGYSLIMKRAVLDYVEAAFNKYDLGNCDMVFEIDEPISVTKPSDPDEDDEEVEEDDWED